MAHHANQVKLDTPTARKRLPATNSVYWNTLSPGCSLGYRRASNTKAGTWSAKYVPAQDAGGIRIQETLGAAADDVLPSDGLTVLSYELARKRATDWFRSAAERSSGQKPQARRY